MSLLKSESTHDGHTLPVPCSRKHAFETSLFHVISLKTLELTATTVRITTQIINNDNDNDNADTAVLLGRMTQDANPQVTRTPATPQPTRVVAEIPFLPQFPSGLNHPMLLIFSTINSLSIDLPLTGGHSAPALVTTLQHLH